MDWWYLNNLGIAHMSCDDLISMLPHSRNVRDMSMGRPAKIDFLHIPDLPIAQSNNFIFGHSVWHGMDRFLHGDVI